LQRTRACLGLSFSKARSPKQLPESSNISSSKTYGIGNGEPTGPAENCFLFKAGKLRKSK